MKRSGLDSPLALIDMDLVDEFSATRGAFDQQGCEDHEVIGEYCYANKQLEVLETLARQRFMPRPRNITEMRPSTPARNFCPFLNAEDFS